MADFILPEEHEKQGFKFIMDRRARVADTVEAPPVVEFAAEPEVICGTEASVEITQLEIPTEQLSPAGEEDAPVESTPGLEATYVPVELAIDKKYFRIGEVSELVGVEPYVLRYWESEFSTIKPVKSGSGHRVYARKDVQTLHQIKHLLYVEKFSIKGAKKRLSERKKEVAAAPAPVDNRALKDLVRELKELVQIARNQPL